MLVMIYKAFHAMGQIIWGTASLQLHLIQSDLGGGSCSRSLQLSSLFCGWSLLCYGFHCMEHHLVLIGFSIRHIFWNKLLTGTELPPYFNPIQYVHVIIWVILILSWPSQCVTTGSSYFDRINKIRNEGWTILRSDLNVLIWIKVREN